MKLESLKALSAVALSSAILAAAFAEPAAAQRSSGGSFGSTSSGSTFTTNENFNLFTETVDGQPIVDSDPSLNLGLFQDAASYFFSQMLDSLNTNNPSYSPIFYSTGLNLITVDKGSYVEFTFVSPNPYQVYVDKPVYDSDGKPVFDSSGKLVREVVPTETRGPGTIGIFNVYGYQPADLASFPGYPAPYMGVALDDEIRSKLVNSLEFIVNNVRDLDVSRDISQNQFTINLGVDVTKITNNSPGGTFDVPEPETTAANFLAGAIGLVTLIKRKFR